MSMVTSCCKSWACGRLFQPQVHVSVKGMFVTWMYVAYPMGSILYSIYIYIYIQYIPCKYLCIYLQLPSKSSTCRYLYAIHKSIPSGKKTACVERLALLGWLILYLGSTPPSTIVTTRMTASMFTRGTRNSSPGHLNHGHWKRGVYPIYIYII